VLGDAGPGQTRAWCGFETSHPVHRPDLSNSSTAQWRFCGLFMARLTGLMLDTVGVLLLGWVANLDPLGSWSAACRGGSL